jgi:ATP-dependent Clp protease ATP-binding subunit ClpB
MTYDNFTENAQDAILSGQRMAHTQGQLEVGTCHLLHGIIDTDPELIEYLFTRASISLSMFKRELYKLIEKYPGVKGTKKQYLSKEANKALSTAKKVTLVWGDQFITPESMLFGILGGSDNVSKLLNSFGATEDVLKEGVDELRQGQNVTTQSTKKYNALKNYAINLNQKASEGQLDPIIGRDDEIRRITHILSRRTKNNPVLVGDPGVGKTAIVEGLVRRIFEGDVPDNLKGKQVFVLDLPSLVAGAKYKGEFEERIKAIVKEVSDSNGEVLLFIDEIHALIGAGGGNGAMDAANIIKPALARGELHIIGATTPEEYQRYFEKDKALVRRFQNVYIDEPSIQDAISILRGVQDRYENYHKIDINDEALVAAVELSHRYITERRLPDKALDLIDEAASKLRLELDSVPEEIDQLQRKRVQLNLEKEFLSKERNDKKVNQLEEQIANTQSDLTRKVALWKTEKLIINQIHILRRKIEEAHQKSKAAEKKTDYEEAVKVQVVQIAKLAEKLREEEEKLAKIPEEERMTNDKVSADNIAEVVSEWTGIAVKKMQQSDKERLLNLEEEIAKRLVGQKEAVTAVCDAVRRSRAGLQDAKKPVGSFIFLGPTGVGKTELAKALAEVLYDDESAITRIDMSEYQEKHAVSRLIGPPPGYVGYEAGGQLTEAVRRKAYSIVLLDEIEKAHPDTFNILLQVLDDGRLTDNKGRVTNFKNTIIIMTSNMGASVILENFEDLEAVGEQHREDIINSTKEEVFEVLKDSLKPEFLNRIDEKIMFLPLTLPEIKKIAGFMLNKVSKNLKRQDLEIEFTASAMDLLAEKGYDPQFGARPLTRVINKDLVNHLAKALLSGRFIAGDTIYVGTDKNGFTFSEKKPKQDAFSQKPKKSAKAPGVDQLKKATKDVEKAIKDIEKDNQE